MITFINLHSEFFLGLFSGAWVIGFVWALRETFRRRRKSWIHATIYRKGQTPEQI